MEFYNWLIHKQGLSKATASKYHLVIKNRISEWLPSYQIPADSIEFEALKQTIFDLDIFKQRNSVGNNMYSSALKQYGKFLKEKDADNKFIFEDVNTFTSEAEKMIKIRLSQNKFRKGLFDFYPQCAVTGFASPQFLIASHIKPWSLSNDIERIDFYNGFLLSANFDQLFDKGYITFKNTGDICISPYLNQVEIDFFKIPSKLTLQVSSQHKAYLEFHFDEIFKK